jgi:glucokinase
MEFKWQSDDFVQDQIILAGDIGGTNTNLALVGFKNGHFTIIMEGVYRSAAIDGLIDPIREVIAAGVAKDHRLAPNLCCISAAGPVENNYCHLTNCHWDVDGSVIQATIGIPTWVINDFTAIGYGIPTLDVNNPEQITNLPHPDGSMPSPLKGAPKAVVGAGTGLGVGYLVATDGGKYIACPSEGGHAGFADFDEETRELKAFVSKKFAKSPGIEPFVSGQGISNIYHFFKEVRGLKIEGVFTEIDAVPDADKPGLISKYASSNAICKEIMRTFIKIYGAVTGSYSAIFIPTGGMYLAGGIAAKNERFFLEDNLFMRFFESNYREGIEALLKKIPVYIIKDYAISIYGAANAAITLQTAGIDGAR